MIAPSLYYSYFYYLLSEAFYPRDLALENELQ